jgi:hypothetical protein
MNWLIAARVVQGLGGEDASRWHLSSSATLRL